MAPNKTRNSIASMEKDIFTAFDLGNHILHSHTVQDEMLKTLAFSLYV